MPTLDKDNSGTARLSKHAERAKLARTNMNSTRSGISLLKPYESLLKMTCI